MAYTNGIHQPTDIVKRHTAPTESDNKDVLAAICLKVVMGVLDALGDSLVRERADPSLERRPIGRREVA
jgi:hypothetical protein